MEQPAEADSKPPTNSPSPPKRSLKSIVKLSLRLVIAALVVWGMYHAAGKATDEMAVRKSRLQREVELLEESLAAGEGEQAALQAELDVKRRQLATSPWSAKPMWLALGGVFYLLGLLPNALFWRATMQSMGARPPLLQTLTAYFVGHLGKYVPGKALVVVLRTDLVSGPETRPATAALAVFVETLTMMAVGGALASLVLVFVFPEPTMLLLAGILVVVAGAPTLPPIFRRIVLLLKVQAADPEVENALDGLNFSLMLRGWPLIAIGWIGLAFSLWATLLALPMTELTPAEALQSMPILLACVALAMVLGFVSLLPGGAGVREWVVMTLLAPLPGVGAFPAFAAAIWLRIIWLVSEIAISTILYLLPFRQRTANRMAADAGPSQQNSPGRREP